MNAPINENTPVIISFAAAADKTQVNNIAQSPDAIDLMLAAITSAAKRVNIENAIEQVDHISVCQGMWPFNNPAEIIKQSLNASEATTGLTKIGVLQQQLISDACLAIQQGKKSLCVVAGGEAKYRDLLAQIHHVDLPQREVQTEPDEVIEPDQELWLEAESKAGLGMPVGYYALMDSAYQAENQLSVETHREAISQLYQQFSEVAEQNQQAWKPKRLTASEIKHSSEDNPMLAFPYTKRHNSSWNVNQASALIICSTQKAVELGVDPLHWVFPIAATAANQMLSVTERTHLSRCIGAEIAAEKLFSMAKISANDLDLIELYSCFPIGVLSFAKALNLSLDTPLTTTGGMPFAGGPLNNFVIQSTVKTLSLLDQNKTNALVSNISGMNTKQGLFLYSKTYQPFQYAEITAEVKKIQQRKEVLNTFTGQASIIASTVLFNKNQPERVVIIAENNNQRIIAFSQQDHYLDQFQQATFISEKVFIKDGQFEMNLT